MTGALGAATAYDRRKLGIIASALTLTILRLLTVVESRPTVPAASDDRSEDSPGVSLARSEAAAQRALEGRAPAATQREPRAIT